MLDPKRIRIRIRKEVKSQIRIRIRYYLKVRSGSGSGSEIDWKVGSGSGSEINNFGSATLLLSFNSVVECDVQFLLNWNFFCCVYVYLFLNLYNSSLSLNLYSYLECIGKRNWTISLVRIKHCWINFRTVLISLSQKSDFYSGSELDLDPE